MFTRLAFSTAISISFLLAPLASAAIIAEVYPGSNQSLPQPNLYVLSDEAEFESYFFSPISVCDLAWYSNSLFIGHSRSGAIAQTDARGGLINLIYTPVPSIDGLAIASNGQIYAADGTSNRLFKLDETGQLLGISFMANRITSLGITAGNDLVFARRTGTSSYSPYEVVFWDFELGEQSTFETTLANVTGLTVVDGEILVAGAVSSSYRAPTAIHRYSATGTLLGSVTGPQNLGSIAAHAPEPGTAILMGIGLSGLSYGGRRRKAGQAAQPIN